MPAIRPGRVWATSELLYRVRPIRTHKPLFDALTTTATELQVKLEQGELQSTDVIQEYIWRTQEYNGWLNAI